MAKARTMKYYHAKIEELEVLRDLTQDLEDAGLIPPAWAKRLEKSRSLRPGKRGRPKTQAKKTINGE